MTHFGFLRGTENGTWGAQIKILRPLFYPNTPLKTPHLDTLGAILDPGKAIFGHFIDFGHFPLKPKNFTANGRKCPTAKTVLESVNKTEQLVGMSK